MNEGKVIDLSERLFLHHLNGVVKSGIKLPAHIAALFQPAPEQKKCHFCSASLANTILVVGGDGGAICPRCIEEASNKVSEEKADALEFFLKDFPPSDSYFLGGCI